MTKTKGDKKGGGKPDEGSITLSKEQVDAAEAQAAQRQQVAVQILKQRFADTEVSRIMAEDQVRQLSAQLEAAKATIVDLTLKLKEAEEGKEEAK